MTADDLIEAYVTDVAGRLPRRQRADVACELRALLREDLQARAEEGGTSADASAATALLQAFGRPADVAARYRPPVTVIDPADGRAFLRGTALGWLAIATLGALQVVQGSQPPHDALALAGRWWMAVLLPSLAWPGMLVIGYAAAAAWRRRWPRAGDWRPRVPGQPRGGRPGLVAAVLGIVVGTAALAAPVTWLQWLYGGRLAPSAVEALTYTDAFLRGQAPWLFGLLLAYVPLLLAVAVRGRWTATLRRLEHGLGLLTCAAMVWVVLGGPVFAAAHSDAFFRFALVVLTAASLLHLVLERWRRVTPAPDVAPGRG